MRLVARHERVERVAITRARGVEQGAFGYPVCITHSSIIPTPNGDVRLFVETGDL